MDIHLREIEADDWAAFRDVRLRALADAPDAFGMTLEQAESFPGSVWRKRAAGPGPTLLAFDDDRPVAMGGVWTPEDRADAYLWGMWIDPQARGRGLGGRIVRELLERARGLDRPLLLHVTEGNDRARALYEAHGFVSTGEWEPLRDGSELRVEVMRWDGSARAR